MKDTALRLAPLPAHISEPLQRALELAAMEDREDGAFEAAMAEAMAAVGWSPSQVRYRERPIPLASALTAEQRAVAELLVEHPEVPLGRWPIYWTPWLRRRWLGLEPGGVLFEAVELEMEGGSVRWPLVHALRQLLIADQEERAKAMVDALPLPGRVEALVGLHLADRDLEPLAFSESLTETTLTLTGEDAGGGDWAATLADWVLAQGGKPSDGVAMLLFAALACSGAPIEPRHDALLRLGWGDFAALGRRCIAAIPSERREAALVAAIEQAPFPSYRIRIGLTYLPDFPYASVARLVLADLERADDPKKVLAKLEAIAKRHPAIGAVLAAAQRALPVIPELSVGSLLRPVTLDALDDVRRRQLEIASRLYSGAEERAEDILGRGDEDEYGERIHPSFLELRTIVGPDGKPLYDAWLYMVDSGTIFRAGTDEVVAEVIQLGVETDDPILRLALPSVLGRLNGVKREKAAKKATKSAEKKTAKSPTKTATKKTAKKPTKTATKKTNKKPAKTATKKTAKKPAKKATKKAAKKPAKTTAKKPAKKATKTAARRPAKKTAAKKTAAKKTAAKKTAAKKTAAKKTANHPR